MEYETAIWAVDPQHPDAALLAQAGALLRAGELVAFPTETVYGLGANALDPGAVARIFAAKERPAADPLIVHIADLSGLAEVAADWSDLVAPLAAAFWPGPLTLVLPRGPAVPLAVTAGGATVAVRMPAHPIALGLIRAAGVPIAAPSANRFTRPSPTRAADVAADLDGRLPLILDGGPTQHGVESTVLDLTCSPPRLLRPGAIPLEQLRALLPNVATTAPAAPNGEIARSPGTLLKHYAPQAELWLFDGPDPARVLVAISVAVAGVRAAGGRAG
ncbi:MAG: L-threonylcarbamoyladenylate synthase, partial [Chloroflexota bacterium]|nr:L-threonylcarbamoyladenylate synthase [Chloroflexota bacterium]